jgi:hypothetical protein
VAQVLGIQNTTTLWNTTALCPRAKRISDQTRCRGPWLRRRAAAQRSPRSLASPARTVRARHREAYPRSADALTNPPAILVHSKWSRELASAKGGRSAATSVPLSLAARHDKRSLLS